MLLGWIYQKDLFTPKARRNVLDTNIDLVYPKKENNLKSFESFFFPNNLMKITKPMMKIINNVKKNRKEYKFKRIIFYLLTANKYHEKQYLKKI